MSNNQYGKTIAQINEEIAASHPGSRLQSSEHGADVFSVQVFDGNRMVADYTLRPSGYAGCYHYGQCA